MFKHDDLCFLFSLLDANLRRKIHIPDKKFISITPPPYATYRGRYDTTTTLPSPSKQLE